MTIPRKILWIDNDPSRQAAGIKVLETLGFDVTMASTLSEGEAALKEHWDLLILDVQIPISKSEEKDYPPEKTEKGHATGLVFYRRHAKALKDANTKILVLTIRTDDEIRTAFLNDKKNPLPEAAFATKYGLRDIDDFLNRVQSLLDQ